MPHASRPTSRVILYSRRWRLNSWKTGRTIIFHGQYALFQRFEEIFMSEDTTDPTTDFGSLWSPGVERGGEHVLQWVLECLLQELSKISLMANSGLPLGPGPYHGLVGHTVQSLFLTKIRTDGYVSVLQLPYRALRGLYCIHRHMWLASLLFPPLQSPLVERREVWWPSTSPCEIEGFCGPLLSGEENPLQV